jgi:hypothetical protein
MTALFKPAKAQVSPAGKATGHVGALLSSAAGGNGRDVMWLMLR